MADPGGGGGGASEPGEARTVVDDEANHRFVIDLGAQEAELVYRLEGDRMVLVHTGVPDEFGGEGIGGDLVAAAVDRAERDSLTVAPWCPFAREWLESNPDVAARVSLDLSRPPSA
jgi:uncharacterized protein